MKKKIQELSKKYGTIRIRCSARDSLPLDVILDFQGSLKKRSQGNLLKLIERIFKLGFVAPFFIWDNKGDYYCFDGHGRQEALSAIREAGVEIPGSFPVAYIEADSEAEAREILLSISSQYGEFDEGELAEWLSGLDDEIRESLRLVDDEIRIAIQEETESDDDIPDDPEPVTKLGDLWALGPHRLLCGDSRDREQVERLMEGKKAAVGANDPPYGMKKEKEGILNDNLNYEDLLCFNKKWMAVQFDILDDAGSFYCFGTDEPLMDIYSETIKPMIKKQKATFRNLITWDKGNGQGQLSEEFRMYPVADEKILFIMMGVQGFNTNADNYFKGWEPIRDYLLKSREAMGWDVPTMKRIVGHSCLSRDHWTSKSQFNFPTEKVYRALQEEAEKQRVKNKRNNDAFKKEYDALKKEYDELKKEYYSTRAYFNNTHDNMNNVWHFEKTSTEEREASEGHASPKPIALCERIIRTSCPENEITVDFFLGSGSTLIACEKTNRICYGIELDPHYCDVIVTRYKTWCEQNGRKTEIKLNGADYRT